MCGIVGYVGGYVCKDFLMEGLSRLEYRGYDSAGFVCIDRLHGQFNCVKEVGSVSHLVRAVDEAGVDGHIGMGHTRWATHGLVNKANAHPHFDCQNNIAIVHNGIIEGYEALRHDLVTQGHDFYSLTDTEVMAHLFEELLSKGASLQKALCTLALQLQGAFAALFLVKDHPESLFLIRKGSPLVIGKGNQEMFIASDPLVFSGTTKDVFFIPDKSIAIVTKDEVRVFDFHGNLIPVVYQNFQLQPAALSKQGYDHFMLKEIYEEKHAIDKTINFYRLLGHNGEGVSLADTMVKQLGLSSYALKQLSSLYIIGAGTSWHAGKIGQFFFEEVVGIPVVVGLASEFTYNRFLPQPKSAALFITQSGETADTLQALRLVKEHKVPAMALTNVASSTIVREADGALLMQAGPEISVCSTKAFSTQLASLYWLAHRIALEKKIIEVQDMKKAEEDLLIAAEVLETAIESYKWDIINSLAKKYACYDKFIFLGRHISYPFAMEAALKLKEISYKFIQSYPAGELKHGPLALIDSSVPVVIFSVLDPLIYSKLLSGAEQVKARGGNLLVFAFEGQTELVSLADCAFVFPRVAPLLAPLAMTGLMQFFAYQITKELNLPIDQPRNLAKSVTVE